MLSQEPNSGIRADHIIEVDTGFYPSPAGSGEVLLHSGAPNALLVLFVTDRHYRHVGPAIVTFTACRQSIFGYPNDEAQGGDPRLRERGYGFFEVRESPWPQRLDTYNRQAFPTSTPSSPGRHFLVTCHESLVEVLADDIRVEPHAGPFDNAVQKALSRLL